MADKRATSTGSDAYVSEELGTVEIKLSELVKLVEVKGATKITKEDIVGAIVKGNVVGPGSTKAKYIAKETDDRPSRVRVVRSHGEEVLKVKYGPIQISERTEAVAIALGSKSKLAGLLEVSASQPTRWIDGSENPNAENSRAILDLDHVIARAGLLWKPTVITAWLSGRNAFLGGARPIDVIKTQGSAPVIDALDQELAGGYA